MTRKVREGETLQPFKERMIDSVSESYWCGEMVQCYYLVRSWTNCFMSSFMGIDPSEELKDNYTAIHNTKHKKLMRKYMQEGKRPSGV